MNPRSLDELFAADPETLSDADIDQMVLHLRDNRHQFHLEKQKKLQSKAPPPAVSSGSELLELLGLNDAEIKL